MRNSSARPRQLRRVQFLKNKVSRLLRGTGVTPCCRYLFPTIDKGDRYFSVYSEETEAEKSFCANLRNMLTSLGLKLPEANYVPEFNDVDLKKLWINPMLKDDFKLTPGSLVMQRKIGSGSFGVVYCALEQVSISENRQVEAKFPGLVGSVEIRSGPTLISRPPI